MLELDKFIHLMETQPKLMPTSFINKYIRHFLKLTEVVLTETDVERVELSMV